MLWLHATLLLYPFSLYQVKQDYLHALPALAIPGKHLVWHFSPSQWYSSSQHGQGAEQENQDDYRSHKDSSWRKELLWNRVWGLSALPDIVAFTMDVSSPSRHLASKIKPNWPRSRGMMRACKSPLNPLKSVLQKAEILLHTIDCSMIIIDIIIMEDNLCFPLTAEREDCGHHGATWRTQSSPGHLQLQRWEGSMFFLKLWV